MDYLFERVSYLRGLSDGLGIDESTKEGKLLLQIVDVLEDFADTLAAMDQDQEELAEYVDYMDEDLADLEDEIFGESDEDDFEDDEEFEDFEDDDIDYIEIECPNCHEIIYLDEELLTDSKQTECPSCHEPLVCDCDDENCEC